MPRKAVMLAVWESSPALQWESRSRRMQVELLAARVRAITVWPDVGWLGQEQKHYFST